MLKSQIITDKLPNVHPGEVLKEEFLDPMNITVTFLSLETRIPEDRLYRIINGQSPVTAEIAIRLSKFFGTTSEFWLNLQNLYDLENETVKHGREFEKIKMYEYA